MFKINKIKISNFKNIKQVELPFNDKRIICILGINGLGKTNILKAIYFLKNEEYFNENFEYLSEKNWDIIPFSNIKNIFNNQHVQANYGIYLNQEIINNLSFVENINEIYEEFPDLDKLKSFEKEIFLSNYQNQNYYNLMRDNYKGKLFNNDDLEILFKKINKIKYSNEILGEIINKNNEELLPEFKISYLNEKEILKIQQLSFKKDENDINYILKKSSDISIFKDINVIYENDFLKKMLKNEEKLDEENCILKKMINILFKNRNILSEIRSKKSNKSDILIREVEKEITNYLFSDWNNEKLKFKMIVRDIKNLKFDIYVQVLDDQNKIIQEKDMLPEDLSSGHLWHIAMKIMFLEIDKSKPTIILLDEPSNHLHIDSEIGLTKFFEEYIENNENVFLIYTTHSPFMISNKAVYLSCENNKKNDWKIFKSTNNYEKEEKNIRALFYKSLIYEKENVPVLNDFIKKTDFNKNIFINEIIDDFYKKDGGTALLKTYNHINEKIIDLLYNSKLISGDEKKKIYNDELTKEKFFKDFKNNFKNNFIFLDKQKRPLSIGENSSFIKLIDSWFSFIKTFRNTNSIAHKNSPKIHISLQTSIFLLAISLINLIDEIDIQKENSSINLPSISLNNIQKS